MVSKIIDKDYFIPHGSPVKQKSFFKKAIQTVMIELTEHCNRECDYCPVSIKPRLLNRPLSSQYLVSIINDLAAIDYDNEICLNLYNEPTFDRKMLIESLKLISSLLPKAKLYFSTNGDYLTQDYLDELFQSGLTWLTISLHIDKGKKFSDDDIDKKIERLSMKLNSKIEIDSRELNTFMHGKVVYKSYDIRVFTLNFFDIGSDRAGSLKTVEVNRTRKAPCKRPFHDITIAYNGYVFPCCMFYPDLPESLQHSIGHFSSFTSIYSIFSSQKMVNWRLSLFDYGKKNGPCATCLEDDSPWTDEQISERKLLTESFNKKGIQIVSYD